MKKHIKIVIFAMAVALSTAPLFAAESAYKYELSPMVGWHMFEGNQNLDDGMSLGLILGLPMSDRWTVEGGFAWIQTEIEGRNIDVDGHRFSLDGLFHFRPQERFKPFLLAGVGAMRMDPEAGSIETDVMANYGAGIKYAIMPNLDLRAELRHVMPFDEFFNNLVAQVGLTWSFGKRETPMMHEEPMMMDSDGDGVPDDMDACAGTLPGVPVDELGCPLVMDADGDGVSDEADLCPGTPEGIAVDEKGCPLDSDGDGVSDDIDACADTPDGEPVDELGCSLPMDADGDGIEDGLDRCANTPTGAWTDERGCWVIKGLFFDSGKTLIKSEYIPILKHVIGVLQANPGVRVAIEGYTDSQGGEAANQRISERRAQAVYGYLVANGVEKDRMEYKGFGEMNPVADNATAKGREKNRRVALRPM